MTGQSGADAAVGLHRVPDQGGHAADGAGHDQGEREWIEKREREWIGMREREWTKEDMQLTELGTIKVRENGSRREREWT